MTRQVEPTLQQLRAALALDPRINIEAAPGSGKTTVAAERFGLYRFTAGVDPRGVLALSFTRSARQELAQRVGSRWGTTALIRPHQALTFDALHQLLLAVLLDQGLVTWAHTATELRVLESWRGVAGARRLNTGDARWVAKLRATTVAQGAGPAPSRGLWMSTGPGIRSQLAAGTCTHDDVRSVVHDALANAGLHAELLAALTNRFRAVIVDEVYDANHQDLDLIALLCEAGLPVTLIGDRWQALYGFRGARPDLVPNVLAAQGFIEHQVTKSFRYASAELELRMSQLRQGAGLVPPNGQADQCDVVLATGWESLWKADRAVLPIGLGGLDNKSDALMTLLLDRATSTVVGIEARNYAEACFVLDVPMESADRDAALDEFLHDLRTTGQPPPFEELRSRHRALSIRRKPTSLQGKREANLDTMLARLHARLDGRPLLRGLSVHQAKGREFNRVGLRLRPAEIRRLSQGLDPDSHDDRVLYVAATRARHGTVLV